MSDVLELKFLDHLTANAAYTPATTLYLGLSTGTSGFGDDGTGAEVSTTGTGYARQAIAFGNAATTSSIANSAALSFGRSTASYGTVRGWGIFDADASGVSTLAYKCSNHSNMGGSTNQNTPSSNNLTYTVTVSGGVYYIDGVQQPTISLAAGYTFRFDQSDASNANHPIAFEDTSDNSAYTAGVISVVGTAGSSGAYTEITVAGALLYHGLFASPREHGQDEDFQIAAGSISLTLSGALQGYAFLKWADLVLRGTPWYMPTALYLALDRTGSSVGPASAQYAHGYSTSGTFDEPRWHDYSTGTVTHSSSGTADEQNAKVRAGVINGSGETYGGYQRCRLVYNPAGTGYYTAGRIEASLAYSVTRDDGLWYNDQARSSNWDSTNNRRQNTGKTELRKWTDRVEFPIAGNSYPVVGDASTPPAGSGVGYSAIDQWATQTGSSVVTSSYTPTSGKHYGTITGWGIFDSENPQTGRLLLRGTFATNIEATAHKDVIRIPASDIALVAA